LLITHYLGDSKPSLDSDSLDGDSPTREFMEVSNIMRKESKSHGKHKSPNMTKDKDRKVNVMDDLFKTSGVFGKRKHVHKKKKSKYWGADELMALMGSISVPKKDEE
jgi:hypothetical protein